MNSFFSVLKVLFENWSGRACCVAQMCAWAGPNLMEDQGWAGLNLMEDQGLCGGRVHA